MRIAVIGCGAVGGVIAAGLTRAGRDVTPIVANPRIDAALSKDGFRVREAGGVLLRIPTARRPVKTPHEADTVFDLAIIATPATALATAIHEVGPFLSPTARIVTCQNGLPEERALALAGDRVVGCVVGWGSQMNEPGLYQRTSRGRLQIGRASLACQPPDDLKPILAAISPVEVVANLSAVRWSKLAINCVTSAFGAIGGAPLGTLLKYRNVRSLALEVFAEVGAVAAMEGIAMEPVAGTLDVARLAINQRERLRRFSPSLMFKHLLMLAVGFKFRRMRSSMLYALERGRPIEIDFLNGEVVKRGLRWGVPTPVNEAIIAMVRQIEQRTKSSSPLTLGEVCSLTAAR